MFRLLTKKLKNKSDTPSGGGKRMCCLVVVVVGGGGVSSCLCFSFKKVCSCPTQATRNDRMLTKNVQLLPTQKPKACLAAGVPAENKSKRNGNQFSQPAYKTWVLSQAGHVKCISEVPSFPPKSTCPNTSAYLGKKRVKKHVPET